MSEGHYAAAERDEALERAERAEAERDEARAYAERERDALARISVLLGAGGAGVSALPWKADDE